MADQHVFEVTVTNFEADVVLRSSKTPILLDFWADWCGPCKTLAPVLEKLAEEYGGSFLLGKVDTEAQRELAHAFQVQGIPFCVLLADGRPIDGFQGALPEPEVRRFLERAGIRPAGPSAEEAEPSSFDRACAALRSGNWQPVSAMLDAIEEGDPDFGRAARLRAGLEVFSVDMAGDESAAAAPAAAGRDLFLQGNVAEAVESWIESLGVDRAWRDGLARRAAVMAFEVLGVNDAGQELVREFRGRMATLLY
ncbi:MAG: tetratricopeptide repeat protein [Planctomycetes bacterium]|nr:tetratricopeptide repeat protein [Planctomycetota bacterium]